METLNEAQLESRIHAFLARKTDQVSTENPLENTEQSQRWQRQHRSLHHYPFSRNQVTR